MSTIQGPEHVEVSAVEGGDGGGLVSLCEDDVGCVGGADGLVVVLFDHRDDLDEVGNVNGGQVPCTSGQFTEGNCLGFDAEALTAGR